jgi:uncharacterized protein YlaI
MLSVKTKTIQNVPLPKYMCDNAMKKYIMAETDCVFKKYTA